MGETIKKEFNPGIMFSKSTTFVEVDNIIFYTDALVIMNLLKMLELDETDRSIFNVYFKKVKNRFEGKSFEELTILTQDKSMSNILMQYLDYHAITKISDSDDPFDVVPRMCNSYYEEIKNLPFLASKEPPFKLTSIGGGLRVASMDKSVEKIYLYSPSFTTEIKAELGKVFRDAVSIELLSGPIDEAIKSVGRCDDYFLQNIESISYIEKGDKKISVAIPGFDYNYVFSQASGEDELNKWLHENNTRLLHVTVPI